MTQQIAVRLPAHLVEFLDTLVAEGARSRASVVERALERELRRHMAMRDVAIVQSLAEDPDAIADEWLAMNARRPLDLD